jgi:hypothetical protein
MEISTEGVYAQVSTGVIPVASHWQTLSHNVVSSTPRHERDSNSQLKRRMNGTLRPKTSDYDTHHSPTTTLSDMEISTEGVYAQVSTGVFSDKTSSTHLNMHCWFW